MVLSNNWNISVLPALFSSLMQKTSFYQLSGKKWILSQLKLGQAVHLSVESLTDNPKACTSGKAAPSSSWCKYFLELWHHWEDEVLPGTATWNLELVPHGLLLQGSKPLRIKAGKCFHKEGFLINFFKIIFHTIKCTSDMRLLVTIWIRRFTAAQISTSNQLPLISLRHWYWANTV